MLLLFAVRMVRTGIERAFGAAFRRVVTSHQNSYRLVPLGVMMAIVLQSSAAVTMLVAGFAGSGAIGFAPGFAMVIGADIGSALLIQVLSLQLDWLIPLLLVVGGILFLKTERRSLRQAGRVTLGIALILLSLDLLREAVAPIRDSGVLPAVAAYLERDYLTGFIAGAVLAFVMHSSVATVLMCVTVVAIGALPVSVGISLVLGANLGSALIPVWLSRSDTPETRRVPLANLMLRGTAAIVALFAINIIGAPSVLTQFGEAQALIILHIGFNLLLLLALPFLRFFEAPMVVLLPSDATSELHAQNPAYRPLIEGGPPASTQQALANLRRELLRMAGVLGDMFDPVMELYARSDPARAKALTDLDQVINTALDGVRRYAADMQRDDLPRAQRKELRALVDYAIAIEAAGDIIVKRLLPLAQDMHREAQRFSDEGRSELENIHARVAANLAIATNVIVGSDLESARQLIEEKAQMGRLERKSRKLHLARLAAGEPDSFNTSDAHLETGYLLKEFNSWIVTIAHPILDREGQLLKTRLVEDTPTQAQKT
ncbi:MAG: Na/Pi cotransporter family protein [Roseovarius sp.]